GLIRVRHLRLELDAILGRRLESHLTDWLVMPVLPEERQGVLEGDTQRFNDVAHPVHARGRGHAAHDAAVFVYRLHLDARVGALYLVHSSSPQPRTSIWNLRSGSGS